MTRTAKPLVALMSACACEATETAASRSTDDFAAFLAEDQKFWARPVKESGAKLD